MASGRDALVTFIRNSRPQREIQPTMTFPLISMIAEGDMVMVATVTYEDDPEKPGGIRLHAGVHPGAGPRTGDR